MCSKGGVYGTNEKLVSTFNVQEKKYRYKVIVFLSCVFKRVVERQEIILISKKYKKFKYQIITVRISSQNLLVLKMKHLVKIKHILFFFLKKK